MERSKQGGQLMPELEKLKVENERLKNLLRETYSLSCIDDIIRDHQNKEEGMENIETITDLKKKIDNELGRRKNNASS